MNMESMYQLPPAGMLPYPMPPGSFPTNPMFDATNHPFFLGHAPQPEPVSQSLFPFSMPDQYYGQDLSGLSPDFALEAAFEALRMNPSPQDFSIPAVSGLPAWNPITALQTLNERPKNQRQVRPGKGFFSSGRGETTTWRPRSAFTPQDNKNASADREHCVKKTIYITDVDQQVTEEQLAVFFKGCGEVVDCRVCGDPNSAMRFAFVEFSTEQAAEAALESNGQVLGDFPLRILPSKTAIVPVNTQYLPKTTTEREKCSRTIYAANIDKKVDRESVKLFFETLCGPVGKIRLLGDWQHSTRIAFVEFINADSAKLALSCSGALLGCLPVRVSPSKTPVRDEPQSENRPPLVNQMR